MLNVKCLWQDADLSSSESSSSLSDISRVHSNASSEHSHLRQEGGTRLVPLINLNPKLLMKDLDPKIDSHEFWMWT